MEQLKKHFSFGTKLVLALAMLFTMAVIFSCEDNPTEPTDTTPSFTTWADYQAYMAGKDWGIMVDKVLEDAQHLYLAVSFPATYAPNDVTSADTFILTVDGTNVPLTVNNGTVSMVQQSITVPKTTSEIAMVFKRNGVVVVDKTVKIAPNPADLSSNQNPDLTAAIPVTWTLARSCSVQKFYMEVFGSGREDQDVYDVTINPTDRSHTVPANTLSVTAPILDGTIYVDEALITESNDSVVVSTASAMRDLYGTAKNVKSAHRNRF